MSLFGRSTVALAAGAALLATLTAAPSARAEGQVSPKGKGIVGGALLGAEVVDLTLAIAGVEKGWPYFMFGALGAAGGGVGGYFVEKAVGTEGPAEAPVFMLAGGLALAIPTVVASLNATSFRPPEVEREVVPAMPVPEPPAPKAGVGAAVSPVAPPPAALRRRRAAAEAAPRLLARRPARRAPRPGLAGGRGPAGLHAARNGHLRRGPEERGPRAPVQGRVLATVGSRARDPDRVEPGAPPRGCLGRPMHRRGRGEDRDRARTKKGAVPRGRRPSCVRSGPGVSARRRPRRP